MPSALRLLVCATLLLTACNLPQTAASSTGSVPAGASPVLPTPGGPGVQILSPAAGAQLPAGAPVTVQFTAAGGPFIEADLLVDNQISDTLPLAADAAAPAGSLTWKTPAAGTHTLTVEVLTPEKQIYAASVQVGIPGADGTVPAVSAAAQTALPTHDPGLESARRQVIQIMHDTYRLDLTSPPVMRKYRYGVPGDPWVSVIFYKNWMYDIEIFPDKVVQSPHPIDGLPDNSVPIPPDQKATSVCRPAGTLKILVAFVDFANLGIGKEQALGTLAQVASQVNASMAHYSTLGGAAAPILQLKLDGVFLSPVPAMPDHLLTPALVKSAGGVDPAGYDLLIQVDLDANNTYRKILAAKNFDTFGFTQGACHDGGLSIWMVLDSKDQALGTDMDKRLSSTITHELLHTFGYPFSHSWACGDGSQPDPTDECDISNWPTLILGWTDTDGDGLPEIVDPTPYGMKAP